MATRMARYVLIHSRQTSTASDGKIKIVVDVIVSIAITASVAFLVYLILRQLRLKSAEPKYIPTAYLKQKWRSWRPRGSYGSGGIYSSSLQNDGDNHGNAELQMQDGRNSTIMHSAHLSQTENYIGASRNSVIDVDRRTSVRSVMTLPTYSKSVRESERVLGREGERDGIDVVLEAPETMDEEEARREEEMASLFEIRQARRDEIRERNERRDRRRAARERGDAAELLRIQEESRAAAQQREMAGAAVMMSEHQSRSRERRISSVSYGDLGVARHDGTRLRADSNESDRPLLNSAASIGGTSIRPLSGQDTLGAHHRGQSTTSFSSVGSDHEFPPFGRAGVDFEMVAHSQAHSRNNSRTLLPTRSRASSGALSIDTTAEIHEEVPAVDPPSYDGGAMEEAPPYTSPIQPSQTPSLSITTSREQTDTMQQLPSIVRLPSIQMTEPTPVEPRALVQFPPTTRATRGSSSSSTAAPQLFF